jgi:Meckel syndrome type 1 protein
MGYLRQIVRDAQPRPSSAGPRRFEAPAAVPQEPPAADPGSPREAIDAPREPSASDAPSGVATLSSIAADPETEPVGPAARPLSASAPRPLLSHAPPAADAALRPDHAVAAVNRSGPAAVRAASPAAALALPAEPHRPLARALPMAAGAEAASVSPAAPVNAEARPEPFVVAELPTSAPLPILRPERSAPDPVAEPGASTHGLAGSAAPRPRPVAAAGTRPVPATDPTAAPMVESAGSARSGAEPVELHIGQVEVFIRDPAPARAAAARPPRAGPSASRLHLRRL